jgi:Mlc titration factor MtfA (ptsG expression regulator)
LIQIFLAEKNFEGCGGLAITPEIRLTIAGHAGLLLLGRETSLFGTLHSILVYPTTFVAERTHYHEDGLVTEATEELLGESWDQGSLVLSWADIRYDLAHPQAGCNVILHEFAHQLDEEAPAAPGVPLLSDPALYDAWSRVFQRDFTAHRRQVARRKRTLLDPYASEDPAEFFAVATELFFTLPGPLKARHREIYELLGKLYCLDPARLAEPT